MQIIHEYSHLGGSEILQVRYPEINAEIYEVINEAVSPRTKVCNENGKKGKLLYNPTETNESFKNAFLNRGYEELRDNFKIPLCRVGDSPKSLRSHKQVDFHKEKVLIEVQFGKYFAMFYDLAKFQYFFNENKADVGVEIVPCNYMKRMMSSGVSYGELLIYDINRLKRHFPAVPIKVILVNCDE